MKFKPFYLFLIAVLVLIAVVVICGKPVIVPNVAVIDDSDTLVIYEPVETVALPFEFDFTKALEYKAATLVDTFPPISFFLIEPEPYFEQAILDTNNVLTIYDSRITVVYDTSKVVK
ncbi:MAG TPA: hypothetical protein ENH87_02140 [Pricia antarctica]|uniref:Uncharacterized protein n=1 Tax=Pricia antarctica TaxID=641691 RepID=A0A831QN49_9FLAO|nr:hypothetical protein [Pricia antarctica]